MVSWKRIHKADTLRNYDEAPKPFQTVFAGDNVFTFPAKGDDPTPLYEGLVATLPFVSLPEA